MAKRKLWPRIYKQENRKDRSFTYYVDLRAVDAGRPGYPTLQEAETRAEQARVQRQNEGDKAFTLPRDVALDATKAHAILSPHGISILEAVRYYQGHVLAYKNAPLVKDIVAKFIEQSKQNNDAPRTQSDKRSRTNPFVELFGDRHLNDITLDEIKEPLTEWEPQNRINYLGKWSELYNFAERNKWVDENITMLIDRPKLIAAEPEVFTVDEAQRLLTNANTFGLMPYIAVGLFAGIRSAELSRLRPDAIDFEGKQIRIPAAVAKNRARRIIDNAPAMNALFAWLDTCRDQLKANEPLYQPAKFRWNKKDFLEAAGVAEWKDNGLRHSFGSYHFAAFENDGVTAKQMGNSPNMVHKHYKALVSKTEAGKFWNLRPA